jgi:hypothetical protein
MRLDELEQIIVDGQLLFCPNSEQWEEIFQDKSFNEVPIGSIELIREKTIRNSKYPIIKSCLAILAIHKKWVMFYELLQLGDEYHRVFIESIICDC